MRVANLLLLAAVGALVSYILKELVFAPIETKFRKIFRKLSFGLGVVSLPLSERNEVDYLNQLRIELQKRRKSLNEIAVVSTPAHAENEDDPANRQRGKQKKATFRKLSAGQHPDPEEPPIRGRIKDLAKELRKVRTMVVLGEPGSGKSVCLRQLAADICDQEVGRWERPQTIPIYVEMETYEGWKNDKPDEPQPVLEFLKESLRSRNEEPYVRMAMNLEQVLEQGRATVVFDALDEMPPESSHQRYQALSKFVRDYGHPTGGNRLIFSCRILDRNSDFETGKLRVVIDSFDKGRIREFIHLRIPNDSMAKELTNRIEADPALLSLVSNPFLLWALTYIYSDSKDASLERLTRGTLIKKFATKLLENRATQHQEDLALAGGMETLEEFLSELAFLLHSRSSLQSLWQKYPQWSLLFKLARRAHILSKANQGAREVAEAMPPKLKPSIRPRFTHHRLQECFAAKELARKLDNQEPLQHYLENIWWQETVLIAIGIAKDARPILNQMLTVRPDAEKWYDDVMDQARKLITITEKA